MPLHADSIVGYQPYDLRGQTLPTTRGAVNFGLRTKPLGRWTFQVTAGDDAADTFNFTADGVSILTAAVAWTTDHNTTAAAIATAINANQANTNFVATVSTDTVTIRQKTGGAVTLAKVVVGDAAGTLTAAFASSSSWTEFISGATFDGDEYYELSWSGALAVGPNATTPLTNAVCAYVKIYVDGQAFRLWSGGLRTASNAIVQGIPVVTATWSDRLPWLDCSSPLVIKVAADEELLYWVEYF